MGDDDSVANILCIAPPLIAGHPPLAPYTFKGILDQDKIQYGYT